MYVSSGNDVEIRLTLEAMVDLVNQLADAATDDLIVADARGVLRDHRFTRAAAAPPIAIERVEERMGSMLETLRRLPESEAAPTIAWINRQLADLHITPWLIDHDGAGLHIHWTPESASFDDQAITDMLMALAQEVADRGVDRFGTCAATDCEHLFYDATRNGSRRFCSDQRCASRTHTADHRARRRDD